jgi:peptidoglycan-N-acetylglucosamine deacetylase
MGPVNTKTCPRCGTQTDATRAACLSCYAPLEPIVRPQKRPKPPREPINVRKALLSRRSFAVYCSVIAAAGVFGLTRGIPRIAQQATETQSIQVAKPLAPRTVRPKVAKTAHMPAKRTIVAVKPPAVSEKPVVASAKPVAPKVLPVAPDKPQTMAKTAVPPPATKKPAVRAPTNVALAPPKAKPAPKVAVAKKAPLKIAKAPAAVVKVAIKPAAKPVRTSKVGKPKQVAVAPDVRLPEDASVPKRYHGRMVRNRAPHFAEKLIAITFDDGPDKKVTPRVLNTLAANKVRATFFVIGQQAKKYPNLLRQETAAGHVVESHSYSHPTNPTESSAVGELQKTGALIRRSTGKSPTCFRPPCGHTRNALTRLALKEGYAVITWTNSGADTAPNSTVASITSNVVGNLKAGDIILIHDGPGHAKSASALPAILKKAKKSGFRFVTVPQLLNNYDKWLVASAAQKKQPRQHTTVEARVKPAGAKG